MESSDTLELIRFIEKAPGYKDALHFAPFARITEILVILGTIDGFIKKRGLVKSEVVIAEIMAGSGYLSNLLVAAGYKNIHAIEASNYMMNDSFLDNKNISVVAIDNMFSVGNTLKEIKPDIIVSLAGFHHLIELENEKVNVTESINKQKKLIDICMIHLNRNGVMIIEDLRDNDLNEIIDRKPDFWSAKYFKNYLKDWGVPAKFKQEVCKSNDISVFRDFLSNCLMHPLRKDSNPTIKWFREVVENETKAGHKDMPICKTLIEKTSKEYEVNYMKLNTPWIFSSVNEFQIFLATFWFLEHKENGIKLNEIYTKAEEINGIRFSDNSKKVYFGWSLALITIRKKEQEHLSLFYENIIRIFCSLILISSLGIILKLYTTFHVVINIVKNILIFLSGAAAKEIYDKIRQKWV